MISALVVNIPIQESESLLYNWMTWIKYCREHTCTLGLG